MLLIMMLVSVVCFIIVMNRRKNGWTSTACFVFPFGFYTILTYSTTSALFIRVVGVVSILLSLVYSILLFKRKIKQKGKIARRKALQIRLSRCMYSVSCIMAVAMMTLMVGIGWKGYFGTGLITSSEEAKGVHQDIKDEDIMEANMDAVLKLQSTVWDDLNTNLRLFKDVTYYSQETDNYINPREDYYKYMSQHLEIDSETYAELGVKEYYTRIEEWMEEKKTKNVEI